MAVRIRMKRLGRRHRPFYRVCVVDGRAARDGRVIEEVGYYDPMIPETDARARLDSERIDYWLSVGAQPSDKVSVLIKKYGANGTHVDAQTQALERLAASKPTAPAPVPIPAPKPPGEAAAEGEAAGEGEAPAETPADEAPAAEAPAAEAPATEAPATETAEAPAEAAAEETPAEKPAEEASGE